MRHPATSGFQIIKKRRLKLAREVSQGGSALVHALDNLVVNVSDIHHVLDSVTFEFKITPDKISKNKRPPVADMREIIDGWTAAVHAHFSPGRINWHEFLHRARQRIE